MNKKLQIWLTQVIHKYIKVHNKLTIKKIDNMIYNHHSQ